MKYLFLLSFLVLCSCTQPETVAVNLEYTKDPRTNLCFASWYLGTHGGVLTNVPCTSEVEREIRDRRERKEAR